ncbi:claudin 11 [Rhinolophus ferrumequinum]|uniref:Claudin n=1 Tax=Rhinolophus ferrumequinum TaxID=59479 RepID=A0A7J8ADY0_RHIFE|nr:claudin 11 [Rhinolophus ferrumequinum]
MMVATCLQVVGFVTSFVGWIGIIVTTSTNDWVVTCGYTIPTCRKLDELGSKGLWADCVMATGLYHCKPLVDILILPALCAIVATIWFPVCAHRETTIVSFGYSLYAGWIGAVLCLVGGCVIVCCAGDAQAFGENRFYYSSGSSSPTHAKSAHV